MFSYELYLESETAVIEHGCCSDIEYVDELNIDWIPYRLCSTAYLI